MVQMHERLHPRNYARKIVENCTMYDHTAYVNKIVVIVVKRTADYVTTYDMSELHRFAFWNHFNWGRCSLYFNIHHL